MTLKIHADPITINCRKVLAGLKFLQTDYELVPMNFFAGEHKESSYLELNPNGTVPLAEHGDLLLWESNAILQYAADLQGNAQAYPTELRARADVNRWLLWEASSWFPCCYLYLVENVGKPLQGETPDQAVLDAQDPEFELRAAILDKRLADQEWLCGSQPTIADIAVAAPLHMHGEAKIPLQRHPNLHRWMTKNIEALPSWEATWVGPGFTLERPTA